MVKNITGGKKAKQSGRKSFVGSNRLKTAQDACEVYAIVLKMIKMPAADSMQFSRHRVTASLPGRRGLTGCRAPRGSADR